MRARAFVAENDNAPSKQRKARRHPCQKGWFKRWGVALDQQTGPGDALPEGMVHDPKFVKAHREGQEMPLPEGMVQGHDSVLPKKELCQPKNGLGYVFLTKLELCQRTKRAAFIHKFPHPTTISNLPVLLQKIRFHWDIIWTVGSLRSPF